MRSTTANYDTYNTLNNKPIVIVDFGITRKYCTQTFNDIDSNYKKYIISANSNMAKIDMLAGRAEYGQTNITIADIGQDVTTQIKNNDMNGRDVTIKIGWQEINVADFVSLPAQTIRNDIRLVNDRLAWEFILSDAFKNLKNKIFRNIAKTHLTAAVTDAGASLSVSDATDFLAPSNYTENWYNTYVAIGNEVIKYGANSSTSFTSLTRGEMGTIASDHASGTEVTQFIAFPDMNPMHILLLILLSDETQSIRTNHPFYDLDRKNTFKGAKIGLSMNPSDIDIETIERFGWKYFESAEYGNRLGSNKEVTAWDWLVENIFKPTGTFPYLNGSGQLSVKTFDWLEVNEYFNAVDTIVSSDIVEGDYKIGTSNLINYIELQYSMNPITRQPSLTKFYKLDDSVTQYGQTEKPYVIKNPYFATGDTNFLADYYLRRWFYFWGNELGEWELKTKSNKWLIEPGDDANVTYDKFPDLISGTMGWTTKKSIVISQSASFFPNREYTLKGITWNLFNRVSSFYTVTKDTSPNDAILLDATNSATVDLTNDAFITYNPKVTGQVFIFFVELTPPNSGTTHHTISLGFHLQEVYETDSKADNRQYVRYYSGDSAAYTLAFMMTTSAPISLDTAKIDWYATSAAAGERPTLKFTDFWYFTLDKTISEIT